MPALQVWDFPADLYEHLRARARGNNRSIAQETIVAVRTFVTGGNSAIDSETQSTIAACAARTAKRERLFAKAEARANANPRIRETKAEEIVDAINEGREERA